MFECSIVKIVRFCPCTGRAGDTLKKLQRLFGLIAKLERRLVGRIEIDKYFQLLLKLQRRHPFHLTPPSIERSEQFFPNSRPVAYAGE